MLVTRLFIAGISLAFFMPANAQIRPPAKMNPAQASPQPAVPTTPATPGQPGAPTTPAPTQGNPTPAPASPLPTTGNPTPPANSPLPATGNPVPTQTGTFRPTLAIRPSSSGPLPMTPAPRSFGSPAIRQSLIPRQGSIANSFPFQQYSLSGTASVQPRGLQFRPVNSTINPNSQGLGLPTSNMQFSPMNSLFNLSRLGFTTGPAFDANATTGTSISPLQPFRTDFANSVGFGRFNNLGVSFMDQQFGPPTIPPVVSPFVPNAVPNSAVSQRSTNNVATGQQSAVPATLPPQFPSQSSGGVGPLPRR